MLPLSPVREWAISRSFTLGSHKSDLRLCQLARQQHGRYRYDIARRFPRAATRGRAIGVKRLDLVADPDRLAQILGAPTHTHAHFVRFASAHRDFRPVQGIDADQHDGPLQGDQEGLGAVGAYKALSSYTQLGGQLTVFKLP